MHAGSRFFIHISLIKIIVFTSYFLASPLTQAQEKAADTFHCKGAASVSGLIQTGDENRTVLSLLSLITLGTRKYEIEPLTSIAYSTKPGKQVEGEYLENIIARYHQLNRFYPAIGIDIERSYLKKIDFRWNLSAIIVWNILRMDYQKLKFGIGYNHESTQFAEGAFVPPFDNEAHFVRTKEQLYFRLKGNHTIQHITISYDYFYQFAVNEVTDYRWTLISNLDYSVTKHFDIRASAVSSYEQFVATNVAHNNFRLTYGINYKF